MRKRAFGAALVAVALSVAPLAYSAGATTSRTLPSPTADRVAPTFLPSTTLTQALGWLDTAIGDRLSALSALDQVVGAAKHLTNAHQAVLSNAIDTASRTLTALAATSSHNATLAMVESDAATAVSLHVLSTLPAEVHLVITADQSAATIPPLVRLEPSVAAAIATVQQAHKSVTRASVLYRLFVSSLAAVSGNLAAESAALVALDESDLVGSNALLNSATNQIATDQATIAKDRTTLQKIVQLLAAPGISVPAVVH